MSTRPRNTTWPALVAVASLLGPILACGGGGGDGKTTYPMERCGMQIELGSHFSQTEAGPGRYAFASQDTQLEFVPTPDSPAAREPATFLPQAGAYDYDRASTFAGYAAREARTQTPMGANVRSRWGAAIDTPQGLCVVHMTLVFEGGPDQFGERFWSAIHDRWLRPL